MLAEVDNATHSAEMQGIKLMVIQDQAEGVTSSLTQLAQAGLEGTLLSILVLFFFLRDWPSTFMVSLAIPICFVITLGCMQMFGMTLNILSMMGLLLAVGMLVDNAVVVVESIYQYREKYPDKAWYCAVQGTQIVGIAIAAGTLSSIIVFLPMVFNRGDGTDSTAISCFRSPSQWRLHICLRGWSRSVSCRCCRQNCARLSSSARTNVITRTQARYARFVDFTLRNRRWTMAALVRLLLA